MERRDELLLRHMDHELPEGEAGEVRELLAADPSLLKLLQQQQAVGQLLRSTLLAQAEEVDFSRVWSGVEREMEWRQKGKERAAAARAEQVGVADTDVSWQTSLRALFGWRTVAGLTSLALLAMFLPSILSTPTPQVVLPAGSVGMVDMVATTQFVGVTVDAVTTDDNSTVVVLQGGDDQATFIWVNESGESI